MEPDTKTIDVFPSGYAEETPTSNLRWLGKIHTTTEMPILQQEWVVIWFDNTGKALKRTTDWRNIQLHLE